jgi:hypothetical protein
MDVPLGQRKDEQAPRLERLDWRLNRRSLSNAIKIIRRHGPESG